MTRSKRGPQLLDEIRPILDLPEEARIRHIRIPVWIDYPTAEKIHMEITDIIENPGPRTRLRNLLLVGSPNSGKSALAQNVAESYPTVDEIGRETAHRPIVSILAPPSPEEGRLYERLLAAINAPFSKSDRPESKLHQLVTLLPALGTRLIVLDEIHDMLTGNPKQSQKMLNILKQLGTLTGCPILAIGLPSAINSLSTNDQLGSRFAVMRLLAWENNQDFSLLLSSFEAVLPLEKPSHLTRASTQDLLYTWSEGLLGELSELLQRAATKAIRTKADRITREILNSVNWVAPSLRKPVRHGQG